MTDTLVADTLVEWVRAVTDVLERLGADWRLLDQLPASDRRRLHRAVTGLSIPDPGANRKRRKAAKAAIVRQEEAILDETGIRALRRRPLVTTPNVFPPVRFEPSDVHGEAAPNDERRTTSRANDERRTRAATPERRTIISRVNAIATARPQPIPIAARPMP